MAEEKIKILVVGPTKSGKTTIANFLCGTRETPTSKYFETTPLRIGEMELELDSTNLSDRRVVFSGGDAKTKRVVVQIWDLGGSSKHQAGWPAVAHKADGIIFVFNPAIKNGEKELSLWHKTFAVNQSELDAAGNFAVRVADGHCLVFAHHSTLPTTAAGDGIPAMPKGLEKIRVLETSLDYHSDNFKAAFDKLIESIAVARMEAEENEVLRRDGRL
ncbi:ADP-ribosylation factor family/Miro-like protein/50S ribosome-binding GTPase [Novymonas esmeraldas]|uniref:ADP-ribosylation factor family/Miro-like protein/50S ribosome-binding GTPase n=1 Tax=Novymonas esmeraldas TaxID=1808958 RepID=A0AAW0ERC7_9TRYP